AVGLAEEPAQEAGGPVGETHDLVGCLAVELEVELGFGAAVVPVLEGLELRAAQPALRERRAADRDADARRLALHARLAGRGLGGDDDADRDQPRTAFVLAVEDEKGVARGDLLAAVHRLLMIE